MFKKKKRDELDFYYLSKDNKRVHKKKKHPKKKLKKKNPEPMNDNMFDIDNEIVIGVTVLPDKNKSVQNNKKRKKKKGQAKKNKNNNKRQPDFDISDDMINKTYNRNNQNNYNKKRKKYKKISPEEERKRRIRKQKRLKIIKFILKLLLFIAIIAGILAFLFISPVFNIKDIEVSGNNKINAEEIKSLSTLSLDQNIFRFSKENVNNGIKQNAYIESVVITRKLPNKVEIIVTERTPSYQIKFGNAYAYIDENGNILEINKEDLKLPLLTGYNTTEDNLKPANKLVEEDTAKLATVNSIIKSAKTNEVYDKITSIDISNDEEYKLGLKTEKKTAYLGDATNINDRMLLLKEILSKEKGNEGEIFINDLEKVFFREKV